MLLTKYVRRVGFLILSADNGGGIGATENKTDLELLQEAQEKITALEGDLTAVNQTAQEIQGQLTAANEKLVAAEAQVSELTTARDQAQSDLATVKASLASTQNELGTIKADRDAKSTQLEQLASRNIVPAPAKQGESVGEPEAKLSGMAKARAYFERKPAASVAE